MQIWALAPRDDDRRAHAAAAARSASCSSIAAPPGSPAPIRWPSSSTTGMTSRTEDDVNASVAAASCVLERERALRTS